MTRSDLSDAPLKDAGDSYQSQHPSQRRNVLWQTQPGLQDNFTGHHFLERLVLNADVQPRNYWTVVIDAQAVSLQVSIVASVLEMHHLLLTGGVGVQTVLLLVVVLICFGQVFVRQITGRQLGGSVLRALRQSVLLIVGVYCLSPLYATLARTISSDTIAAASAWLLAVHLYIHDYFFKISVAYKLSGSLSMVAAVAASLLLASRLGSPQKVFAQILFSLTAFVLLPFTCQHIQQQSHWIFTTVVVVALAATSMLLATFSWQVACAYMGLHICLVFMCPRWLLQIEKFKAKINGPWDEAVPKLTEMVRESSHDAHNQQSKLLENT